jgi:hypothetical protein
MTSMSRTKRLIVHTDMKIILAYYLATDHADLPVVVAHGLATYLAKGKVRRQVTPFGRTQFTLTPTGTTRKLVWMPVQHRSMHLTHSLAATQTYDAVIRAKRFLAVVTTR